MTNIYVGNLAFSVTEDELRSAFEEYGSVEKVNIIKDRETGRSRGFVQCAAQMHQRIPRRSLTSR